MSPAPSPTPDVSALERRYPDGLRVVVTGGPGSGKTTLVEALGALGCATVPEAAIQVIEELNRVHGVEGQATWRHAHRQEFQNLVLARQVQLEEAAPDRGLLFLDRGRLDGVAYCRFYGSPLPPGYAELAGAGRYDRVLLLETLRDFRSRRSTGRTSGRAQSVALGAEIEAVYAEAGHKVQRIPELGTAEDRLGFVLSLLGRPSA